MLNGAILSWSTVTNRVLEEPVLGLLFFIIYVNIMDDEIVRRISKSAKDSKLSSKVVLDAEVQHYRRIFVDWVIGLISSKCRLM